MLYRLVLALLLVPLCIAAVPQPSQAATYRVRSAIPFNRNASCGTLGRCNIAMDAYIPAHPIQGSVVILLHGGPSGLNARRSMSAMAGALASRGVLTYSADFRDLASQGASYANTMADVACAAAAVRRFAPGMGGRATHVIVVGFSLGGWIGAAATMLTRLPGPCGLAAGAHPDIVYGLSGCYDIRTSQRASDMARFFGSLARIDARLDTLALASAAHRHVTYHVVAERWDGVVSSAAARAFRARLLKAGDRVVYQVFSGSTHSAPANPATAHGAAVVRMIVASALDPDHD